MNKSSNATVTRILRGLAVAATGLALGAYAGSAVQDGTDFVITAESGESYTYSTAVGNYTRLVKRGAGEAVLDTASSSFSGSVVVEAGTLTIANNGAVGGTSGSITVQNGATLHLKLPGATKFGHDITIVGSGVNDAGAFRYTRSNSSGNSDSLINNLTLSGDATIDVSSRWGVASGKALELNGHTLTRIGTSEWMVMNKIQSTGAPGEVNNVYGKLTFQGSTPFLDENVTVVVTNIDASSYIALWSASMGGSKGTIKVYNGRNIQPQSSGTTSTANHIGPLHLAGNTASVTLNTTYNNNARAMSVDGPVTGDNGVGLLMDGKGSVWFNNAVTLPGTATIQGGGNVYFNGDVSITGNTTVTGNGTLSLGGENAARNMKLVLKGNTTTTHEAGKTFLRMLRVANSSDQRAQLRQTGGVIGVPSSDGPRIGETVNQRAYYTLEGGEFHASNTVFIAEKPTSFGAFRQTGGFFESYNRASGGTSMFIGRGGNALFVQTGGTNDISHIGSKGDQSYRAVMGSTNGVAEVTISGVGTEFRASGLMMGNKSDAPTTNILNIANGGKLKVNRFRKNDQSAATSLAVVNANGGILAPTFSWNLTGGGSAATYPDHFVVWENGFIVDTTENAVNNESGTGDSSLPFAFEKPTGKGVESITLPDLTGTNYIGIGRIVIEDATGWGASAYAEFDFTTKKLTHVVVTSRGCNYSDNAKAYLESPAGTTRYECVLTLSDNTGKCGPIVKRGGPDLVLGSTTSTIDGGYAVEEGALRVASVPESAIPVRVEAGATLNFSNKSPTFSTFEGAGTVTNGTFTVTDTVRAKCADIFTNKSATFTSALTLGDNAVFEITDAENLSTYKNEATAVALTATSISRQPALLLTNSNGTPYAGSDADQWVLARSSDGKTLKFGCPKPFTLVVR